MAQEYNTVYILLLCLTCVRSPYSQIVPSKGYGTENKMVLQIRTSIYETIPAQGENMIPPMQMRVK